MAWVRCIVATAASRVMLFQLRLMRTLSRCFLQSLLFSLCFLGGKLTRGFLAASWSVLKRGSGKHGSMTVTAGDLLGLPLTACLVWSRQWKEGLLTIHWGGDLTSMPDASEEEFLSGE